MLHYTSGTTGRPKGAQHVHYSLISQYLTSKWVLDLRDDDIYWCNADPGWVTGTSYGIIGPWACGATQVVLDAGFNAQRWYQFLARRRVTVWYSAPTAIRLLMREGAALPGQCDLSSLRHLCSVGEPLNPEAVTWSADVFGRPFHDTYWQTETGCIVITNFPGMRIKPGSMGKPFPGITAALLDPRTFEPIDVPGRVGLIALRPSWPSMMRAYWKNPDGYAAKFRNGWYVCGDRATVDADGYFWFVGRDDDVINTAGHLVGPFEIESALLEHPAVAESAAVAKPDPVNMEVVKAFVTLKRGFEPGDDLELDIMNTIRRRLSPLAMPQEIEFVATLPRTRSGKIVRRVLRAKEFGEAGRRSLDADGGGGLAHGRPRAGHQGLRREGVPWRRETGARSPRRRRSSPAASSTRSPWSHSSGSWRRSTACRSRTRRRHPTRSTPSRASRAWCAASARAP